MPGPADSSDNLHLQRQIEELQTRVSALETRFSLTSVKPESSAQPADSRFPLTIVNRIGALTLALGILFFFKYAADSGWIGPVARVSLGLLTGAFLLGASEWIDRRQGRILSQGLAACGLAAVFISLYAAYGYYRLISALPAFVLILLLCQATVALSILRKNIALTALGLFGTLLIPQLIALTRPQIWTTIEVVYLLFLQAQSLLVAAKHSSRTLLSASAIAIIIVALAQVEPHGYLRFFWLAFGLSVVNFAASRLIPVVPEAIRVCAYIIGHCFMVVAGTRAIAEWFPSGATASTLASVLLAVYGVILLALGLSKAKAVDRSLGFVFLGLVIAKLYLYDIWQLNYAARITAFVVLGGLLLGASFLYGRTKSRDN